MKNDYNLFQAAMNSLSSAFLINLAEYPHFEEKVEDWVW